MRNWEAGTMDNSQQVIDERARNPRALRQPPETPPREGRPCRKAYTAGPGACPEHRTSVWRACLLAVVFGLCTPAFAQTISTVAGTGTRAGDGGPATGAQLHFPAGVFVDAAGNLFIADQVNHRIRKVDPAGTISTVAGTDTRGFSGDGGPATGAQLDGPLGVSVDAAGNLFIADTNNSRIRKVDPAGTISTVAGTGAFGFSGDGGPATGAQLHFPTGVFVDAAGNLFIADVANHRIRKVDPAGTISTVAGTGAFGFSGDGGPATAAQLNLPFGVFVDAAGNLFIADTNNDRIRQVDPAGTISTVAGADTRGFSGDGGPATGAQLNSPSGVFVDAAGNLFIADRNNDRIRQVDPAGTISTVAGAGTFGFSGDGGPATGAQLNEPHGVFVDAAGNLFIADRSNHRIRQVDPAGTISTVAGTGTFGFSGDGQATRRSLIGPHGVFVDAAGNLFIADQVNHRIRKVAPAGTISTVAGVDTRGFSGDGGPAIGAQLQFPAGVFVDPAGNLFIADSGNHRIRKVDPAGTISTVAGTGVEGFSGDGGPATGAQLHLPSGVFVDAAGNLFIADRNNHRIRKVAPAITAVVEVRDESLPQSFALSQNYPNPFNPETTIRFDLPRSGEIDLAVYNLAGQKVATLALGVREAGAYTLRWDGRDDDGTELASGVYLYRLRGGGGAVETRKLLLLR